MAEKPIAWIRTSFDDLFNFPVQVKKEAGYQLHRVQNGYEPEHYKPFKQIGPGVNEVRISETDGIYRIMYVAKFPEAVYVLHAFEKKTQKTSKKDIDTATTRYKAVIAERDRKG
ncbi:MAG: phage-related protein [Phenylobacterium sp.]|jgi:phage-related protein